MQIKPLFATLLLGLNLLGACSKDAVDDSAAIVDNDGDGFGADEDCDDNDAAIHPDADELCDDNSVDEDCDGLINDADDNFPVGEQIEWFLDADADGFGDGAAATLSCVDPSTESELVVEDNTDCDDSDSAINPAAQEICDPDNVDEDCDGLADDEQPGVLASTKTTWYADSDSDGFGDINTYLLYCEQPTGYVADNTDCDDNNAPNTYPGAAEHCDSVDTDCDGTLDEDDALDVLTWYADTDADGYGNASSSDIDCYQPTGFVADNTDCDDNNAPNTYPGAAEYCDSVDTDCDGTLDEDDALDVLTWYADTDADA
jgi:hypothetical protein